MTAKSIFISYAGEDVEQARLIVTSLERRGWSVWWDRNDIAPGRRFADVIDGAIASAKVMIVLWSKHSIRSEWVLDEASDGKDRNILIPVLIDDVTIPRGFRQRQTMRLIGWNGEPNHPELEKLQTGVASLLGWPADHGDELDVSITRGLLSDERSRVLSAYSKIPRSRKNEYEQYLVARLDDQSSRIRMASLLALYSIRRRDRSFYLVRMLSDQSNAVRRRAVFLMGESRSREFVQAVSTLLSDASPDVRAAARDAARKLPGMKP